MAWISIQESKRPNNWDLVLVTTISGNMKILNYEEGYWVDHSPNDLMADPSYKDEEILAWMSISPYSAEC